MRHVFMLVLLTGFGLALADPSTCAGGGVCVSNHQPIDFESPSPSPQEEDGNMDGSDKANAQSLTIRFRMTVAFDKARES